MKTSLFLSKHRHMNLPSVNQTKRYREEKKTEKYVKNHECGLQPPHHLDCSILIFSFKNCHFMKASIPAFVLSMGRWNASTHTHTHTHTPTMDHSEASTIVLQKVRVHGKRFVRPNCPYGWFLFKMEMSTEHITNGDGKRWLCDAWWSIWRESLPLYDRRRFCAVEIATDHAEQN